MKLAASLLRRSFFMILLSVMMFVLSACSAEEASRSREYYEQLSSYTDTLLMQNRELNKIKEKWDYKDKKSTKNYIDKLSEIEESLGKIRGLDATELLSKTDEELKSLCDTALESLALTKATAQSAYDTKDISVYDKNDEENFAAYSDAYEDIIGSVETVRVMIR